MKKEITKEMIENFESQNQVSVIINGVRYDAVETKDPKCCPECELPNRYCGCHVALNKNQVFKKSDKKFEV